MAIENALYEQMRKTPQQRWQEQEDAFSERTLAEVTQEMDERAQYGHTPLMDSVSYEAVSAVEAWTTEGADVNARDNFGFSPRIGRARWGIMTPWRRRTNEVPC